MCHLKHFYVSHWLTEKKKERVPIGSIKNFSNADMNEQFTVLERRRANAGKSFQPIRAQKEDELRKEAEERQRMGQMREMPFDQMFGHIQTYLNSDQRRLYYEEMANMEEFLTSRGGKHRSHVLVRDFLMLELLVLGGNNRPEVVYNLQVQHITTSKVDKLYTEKVGDGRTWRCAYMYQHMTSSQGPAILSFHDPLFALLLSFIEDVRPSFGLARSPSSFLFPTLNGGPLNRVPQSVIGIFRELSGYDGDCLITPNIFRLTGTTFRQRSSDPEVRRGLP